MAARTWSLEQRRRQSEAIQNWKPWERSTGPKSPEGKARVSGNGWQGGSRQMMRDLARALRDQRNALGNL